jgi:hypothetical protein
MWSTCMCMKTRWSEICEALVGVLWYYTGALVGVLWYYTGALVGVLWYYTGALVGVLWYYTGSLTWYYTGSLTWSNAKNAERASDNFCSCSCLPAAA